MKVLLVMGTTTGGIGAHVRALAQGLEDRGHQAVIVQDFRQIKRAAAGADVVHAHGIRAGAVTALVVGGRGRFVGRRKRLVVTIHNAPLPDAGRLHRMLSTLLEWLIARRADVVLGASEDLVARTKRLGARDVRFAPVAAVRGEPTTSRGDVRAELGLPPGDRPIVLAIGRLAPQKDYPTLLDAVAMMKDLPTTPIVLIAGDGPLRAELQRRVDEDGLPVRLLGHRADVPALLSIADVFVMSSTWEARPLALQEAMSAGVASVVTAVGGIPDLVGDAAVLVPAKDSAALAAAVIGLVEDVPHRCELAGRAKTAAASRPGMSDSVHAVLAAYRESN